MVLKPTQKVTNVVMLTCGLMMFDEFSGGEINQNGEA
jgi:hypothetical protein